MFHPFLGPVLMVTYALLSNTLLLTVLVAILGNTFATINADAVAEVSELLLRRTTLSDGVASQCFAKQSQPLRESKRV